MNNLKNAYEKNNCGTILSPKEQAALAAIGFGIATAGFGLLFKMKAFSALLFGGGTGLGSYFIISPDLLEWYIYPRPYGPDLRDFKPIDSPIPGGGKIYP